MNRKFKSQVCFKDSAPINVEVMAPDSNAAKTIIENMYPNRLMMTYPISNMMD